MNIPAGVMVERFGRKKILVVGAVGLGIFASLSGAATGMTLFIAARLVAGLFNGMVATTANVVVADLTTVENRGRALGLTHAVQLITGIASPAVGGLLAEVVDIRAPYYISGIGVLVFGAWALLRLPETRPGTHARGVAGAPGTTQREHASSGSSFSDAMALLRSKGFMLVCLLGFAQFFTRTGASHSLIPLFADRVIGLSPGTLGLFFSGASVLHSVLVYPAGVIADRYGRKVVIVPANLALVAALVLVPFGETVLLFAFTFTLVHAAQGYGGQAPMAYLGDVAPEGSRGLSFGIWRTFGDAAGMIAPLTVTALVAAVSFEAAFIFNAAIVAIITIVFAKVAVETAGMRRRRDDAGVQASRESKG